MIPILLQASYPLGSFAGFIGVGIVQALGGSLLLLGLGVLLTIGFLCWRLNVHITAAFFLSFIALSFLKLFFNDPGFTDIGLFGTLYNIMLLGMAIIFVLFINDLRK